MNTLPSISEHIDEKIINKVIQDNFAALAPYYFTLTSNWFVRAYDHWKDIDKFVIIIYLIHQDLVYFRQNGLKIDYETFYEKKSIEKAVTDLENAIKEENIDSIETSTKSLNDVLTPLSEKLYQAGEDQGVSEEPNNSDDENTVEAEFEEVKEEDSK